MEIQHNPILNGTTKRTVHLATILVGILTLTGLISLVYIAIQDIGVLDSWKVEGILGSFDMTGLGILGALIKIFMDTRSTQEKDKTKLAKYEIKMTYKTAKMKWKFKNTEIMQEKENK